MKPHPLAISNRVIPPANSKCKYDSSKACTIDCTAERCYFRFSEEMFRTPGERKEMKKHKPQKSKHYKAKNVNKVAKKANKVAKNVN